MDLREQFRYEGFCLRFAQHLFPLVGAEEITVENKVCKKVYSHLQKIHIVPFCPNNETKADVSFRIGCEYGTSYTLKGKTYIKDEQPYKNIFPYYITKPLNIVVRKDIKLYQDDIIKHMKETFKSNILYLMRYSGKNGGDPEELKKTLIEQKLFVVFYHEINYSETLMDELARKH